MKKKGSEKLPSTKKEESKGKSDFVFEVPKEEVVATKSKSTKEMTLEEIMKQQEKDTKKQAEERRKKDAAIKAQDPFNLDYIKPSSEEIFKGLGGNAGGAAGGVKK
jgi:hypothetical protein